MSERVLIIGSGLAGLSAAAKLPPGYDVTVISSRRCCDFLPNIHELSSGNKRAADLWLDAVGRVESLGHRFVLDELVETDPERRSVCARSSGTWAFDARIVVTGGVNGIRGVLGAERFAMPFKSVDDCERIGERPRDLCATTSRGRGVVVGGGLEGIGALGEILRAFPAFRGRHRRRGPAAARRRGGKSRPNRLRGVPAVRCGVFDGDSNS